MWKTWQHNAQKLAIRCWYGVARPTPIYENRVFSGRLEAVLERRSPLTGDLNMICGRPLPIRPPHPFSLLTDWSILWFIFSCPCVWCSLSASQRELFSPKNPFICYKMSGWLFPKAFEENEEQLEVRPQKVGFSYFWYYLLAKEKKHYLLHDFSSHPYPYSKVFLTILTS